MAKDDHVLLNMEHFGARRFFLNHENIDLDWPPPERIIFDGDKLREATENDEPIHIFKRIRMSQFTDEQIAECDGIARGAEYIYEAIPTNEGVLH